MSPNAQIRRAWRDYIAARRRKARKQGICPYCLTRPRFDRYVACETCHFRRAFQQAQRREKLKETV